MNANVEILNYLNLINKKLGKQYQLTGYNPLPENFTVSKDAIKEIIFLQQQNSPELFQKFVFKDKKEVKNLLKTSQINVRKLLKKISLTKKLSEFGKKFYLYLLLRQEVTNLILKDFKKYDFNEFSAFEEIYLINPIFGEMLENFFTDANSFENIENIEQKYNFNYLEKLKLWEKKAKKLKQQNVPQINIKKSIKKEKNIQKIEKITKKPEKSLKNNEKTLKNGILKTKNENKEK